MLHKQKQRNNYCFLALLFFIISMPAYGMMEYFHSPVFTSSKSVNELVKYDSTFLYRLDAVSALRSFEGEMSFVQRLSQHYSLSGEITSSFNKVNIYNGFEGNLSRGFTDGTIYGLLSVGYRIAHYGKKEQWLVFSTGTGFIPAPYGIESSVTMYYALTEGRCSRIRGEIIGLYRAGSPNRFFDFGLQASIYIIPSGELSIPSAVGYTQGEPLIEEFMQFEGGILARFAFNSNFILRLLVTNVVFINQTNFEVTDPVTGTQSTKYGSQLTYAPKAILGMIFKF
jgi:hypothetical protein